MLDVAIAVDDADPHVVRILDRTVRIRVLLAEAANVHLAVLHRRPLRFLTLVVVSIPFHHDVTRNGLRTANLISNSSTVIKRIQLVPEPGECTQLHSSSRFTDFASESTFSFPLDRIVAITVTRKTSFLHNALPLSFARFDNTTLFIEVRHNHEIIHAVLFQGGAS